MSVTKDLVPLRHWKVGGDDQASLFVDMLSDYLEQQSSTSHVHWNVAKLVQDQKIAHIDFFDQSLKLIGLIGSVQCVNEVGGTIEKYLIALLTSLDT